MGRFVPGPLAMSLSPESSECRQLFGVRGGQQQQQKKLNSARSSLPVSRSQINEINKIRSNTGRGPDESVISILTVSEEELNAADVLTE